MKSIVQGVVVLAVFCGGACMTTDDGAGEPDGAAGAPQGRDCQPNFPPDCIAELCRDYDCGAPSSVLDEDGCYRAQCSAGGDCAVDEECREIQYSPPSCGYAPPDEDVCDCGGLGNLLIETRCFPRQ